MNSQSTIAVILGMRGCGKSTMTRIKSSQHPRLIVFDIVDEWNDDSFFIVHNFKQFANVWREMFHQDDYTIVVKFDYGTSKDLMNEIVSQIVALIWRTGKDSGLETCLVFEEAQFYFPNHGMHPNFMHLITTGRHARINMICNTQQPAEISKLLISQSSEIYLGRIHEPNAIKYLEQSIGEIAEQTRSLELLQFLYYPVGHLDQIVIVDLLQNRPSEEQPPEPEPEPEQEVPEGQTQNQIQPLQKDGDDHPPKPSESL